MKKQTTQIIILACIVIAVILLVIIGTQSPTGEFEHVLTDRDTLGPSPVPPPGSLDNLQSGTPLEMGGDFRILDCPIYLWHDGCAPTALAMIYGYWDVVADTNYLSLNPYTSISSTEHYNDYILPMDEDYCPDVLPDKSTLGGAHASNCIADFLKTSRSQDACCYGNTVVYPHTVIGILEYAEYRGQPMLVNFYGRGSYTKIREEIIAGRPVLLGVDASGDGNVDHAVTAVGYNDVYNKIGIYTTWNRILYWIPVHSPEAGNAWGIGVMWTISLNEGNLTRCYKCVNGNLLSQTFDSPDCPLGWYDYVVNCGGIGIPGFEIVLLIAAVSIAIIIWTGKEKK